MHAGGRARYEFEHHDDCALPSSTAAGADEQIFGAARGAGPKCRDRHTPIPPDATLLKTIETSWPVC